MRAVLAIAAAVVVAFAYSRWGLLGAAGACAGVAGVGYVVRRVSLAVYPNRTACWFCGGKGQMPFSTKKRNGPCWFCHGRPRKLRRGAKEPK